MSAKTPNEQVGELHKAAADGLTFAKLLYLQWNLRCRVAEIGQVRLDTATGNHDILWVPSRGATGVKHEPSAYFTFELKWTFAVLPARGIGLGV